MKTKTKTLTVADLAPHERFRKVGSPLIYRKLRPYGMLATLLGRFRGFACCSDRSGRVNLMVGWTEVERLENTLPGEGT